MSETSDVNVQFSRALLRGAHGLVRLHHPEVNLVRDAWVYHFHRDHWEFHGPDGHYWHGRASCAAEARYRGWMSWLRSRGADA
jgi:hypothetical protein